MNTKVIAKNLIHLRQSRNWTQEDIAGKLHISRQAISKWETGSSLPNLDFLIKLSGLYNISINEILEPPAGIFISKFEEIININEARLKAILQLFSKYDIVKASMGASPTIGDLLRKMFIDIDFDKERINIGSIRISEVEEIHNRIVDKVNLELG